MLGRLKSVRSAISSSSFSSSQLHFDLEALNLRNLRSTSEPQRIMRFVCALSIVTMVALGQDHIMMESRIEQVKATILRELGMSRPPNISQMNIPIAQLRAQFQPIFEKEYANAFAQGLETFYSIAKQNWISDYSSDVAVFDVSDDVLSRQIENVELSFNLNINTADALDGIIIKVHQQFGNGTMKLVGVKKFSSLRSDRVTVTLEKEEIERTLVSTNRIVLRVEAIIDGDRYGLFPESEQDKSMMLAMKCSSRSRSRRAAAPVCLLEKPMAGCCRYDMIVDFDKIGWEWIIAPPRYNAFICRGDCALNGHHMHKFGHTKLVKAVTSQDSSIASFVDRVGSCCHAGEYEPLSVIYINHDGAVVASSVSSMIATRCSCS
ncbi:unnamed protein product [Caenorhabditis auriculariae]|uniref:TGF-beta family profile domain-containing protein n=1 Tax=Caenorhabditis auriculariae TaxID=2777116 RepID=A0A8S1H0U6_9PELO|nr:unnamed protein product [Caenorhabditis auriculariae]